MDFSSLDMENIENILSSMSSEDMEKLTGMAQSLFSSAAQGGGQSCRQNENNPQSQSEATPFSSFNIEPEAIFRIMSFMEKLNRRSDDPGQKLLMSLKPMLSSERQSKVDEALRLMSLLSLIPLINELGGSTDG